jgi:[ribosomal protein S18]-alanine N-acetyltransferase
MQFVKLTADNCQSAFNSHLQCHAFPWSYDVFASSLEGQYFAYQMQQSDEVVGYYVGLTVLDEATLMDIGLALGNRGKGLSSLLLSHFLTHCKELHMLDIWLEVRQSNIPAIALYKKAGFELIERRKGYYPCADGKEDALIMKLSLND